MHKLTKNTKLKIIASFFWFAIIFLFLYAKYILDLSNHDIAKNTYHVLADFGIYSIFLYILIYTLRIIIFFPSPLLTIIAPSLFGLFPGILIVLISVSFTSSLGYLLGRLYGVNLLDTSRLKKFKHLKNGLQNDTFFTVLTMRLIFLPFDPVCYISGFFKAKFRSYFFGTLFGTLPVVLVILFLGAGIQNIQNFDLDDFTIHPKYFIFSLLLGIISLLIAYYIKKNKP